MRLVVSALIVLILAGCGHSRIAYTPSPLAIGITEAASIVEQGFYEDFSQQKPQSAMVTAEYIGLSNGSVTRGLTTGTVSVYNGVAVGLGSTFLRTEEITQRIYFRSLGTPILSKRNGRENRFAVTIRLSEGVTARNVYFRSEHRAKEFADALVFLHNASTQGELGKQPKVESTATPPSQSNRDQRLQQLMQENLPYDEYQRQHRAIMAEDK
ncbi:MAG: hypothetical protein ABWY06_12705 [Pseudomonas sp.]|uniref:hypothetical protein n=1 Tax=Pseudomonas sp. TaxID=306 RepID=UPI003395839D